MDKTVLAEMQRKVQKEMVDRERRLLEYWRSELEKIYQKRHNNLATLQLEIKGLLDRMENRMRILRKEEGA
jgi:Skp family chaperone for outer membrane proteins